LDGHGRPLWRGQYNAATDQPNVSIDFNHDPRSSIFHMDQTKVMDGTLVRVVRQ